MHSVKYFDTSDSVVINLQMINHWLHNSQLKQYFDKHSENVFIPILIHLSFAVCNDHANGYPESIDV